MRAIILLIFTVLSLNAAPARSASPWIQLFNGHDLDGWEHTGPGSMTVERGMIHTHDGTGVLYWTRQKFADGTLRVVYRMNHKNDNSGVFIRMPTEPHHASRANDYGYEVQIDNEPEKSGEDDYGVTGTLWSFTRALARPGKPGPKWNEMEITMAGPHITVTVNGVKVTDFREGDPVPPRGHFKFSAMRGPRPLEGYIGLQNHDDVDSVDFKEVSFRPAGG